MTALSPLHAAAQEARSIAQVGRRDQAAVRLGAELELHDPIAAAAHADLIDAAVTYAFIADRSPERQLSWARYAYRASVDLFGRDHQVTTDAAEALASVYVHQGLSVDAIAVLAKLSDTYLRRNDIASSSLPGILTGLRLATVSTVALVTVGSLIGKGGLGDMILGGFRNNFYKAEIMTGTILCVGLALVLDLVLAGLGRLVTPWARERRS